ncbi:hypothetical protein ACWDYH_38305 [Nocardia goodfellowii]
MHTNATSAIVAAALHRVFANSPHAFDSVELWMAISAEAQRQLSEPLLPVMMPWLPVFLHYRQTRSEGEFFPYTGSVRILTGPLAGITYTDLRDAAHAILAETTARACGDDPNIRDGDTGNGDAAGAGGGVPPVPTWRFRVPSGPDGQATHAVIPLIS